MNNNNNNNNMGMDSREVSANESSLPKRSAQL